VFGRNAERAAQLRARGLSVTLGDRTDRAALKAVGAGRARAVLAISSYDDVNVEVAKMATLDFDVPDVIALIRDAKVADELIAQSLGVRVIRPQLATVLALEGALHFPAAFEMLTDPSDGVEVREISLQNAAFIGKRLREVQLVGDALLMGIRRGEEVFIPHGNTRLMRGDLLMLVGHEEALAEALAQFT